MRKLCSVLFVIAICVVGIGFYRGWFALSNPSPPKGSNSVNVNLTTDPERMKEDAEALKDKAEELTGNADEADSSEPADRPRDEVQTNQLSPNAALARLDGNRQYVFVPPPPLYS